MKRFLLAAGMLLALGGCTSSKDLAKTLRYADQRAVAVEQFDFTELDKLERGEACTVNFLNFLPLFGDGSLITAVEKAKISRIRYVGETGYWYFPFCTHCTVVFGEKAGSAVAAPQPATTQGIPPAPAVTAQDEATGMQAAPTPAQPRRDFWQ